MQETVQGATLGNRFTDGVNRLIGKMERNHLGIVALFIYVISLALIRDFSEYYLLDYTFISTAHPWIFSIAHHVAFYVVVFLGLVLLLTAFSGRGLRRSANFVSCFYWIIILPPFLDYYLFGLRETYSYYSWTDFINALVKFGGGAFHPGQGVEVIVVLFGMFSYTIWVQRESLVRLNDRLLTGLRVVALIGFTLVSMFFMATPGVFVPVGFDNGVPIFPFFDFTRYYQFHLFLLSWYVAIGMALILSIGYIALKRELLNVISSMRPFQSVLFGGVVLAGVYTGWHGSSKIDIVTPILQTPYWVNLPFVFLIVVSALMAWWVSTIWNDLSDVNGDSPEKNGRIIARSPAARSYLAQISVVLLVVSLSLAALISWTQFLILIVLYFMSFIYSFPPVRFKRYLMSPLLIGLGTFFAFIYGALTPYSEININYVGPTPLVFLTGLVIQPDLTIGTFLLGFYMFVGLVIGSMVTDIDGYEEDRISGVKTIYTKYGLSTGTKYVSVLVLLSALTPLAIMSHPLDLLVFPILGAIAAYLMYRQSSSHPVMALAIVGLIYSALRYGNFLG